MFFFGGILLGVYFVLVLVVVAQECFFGGIKGEIEEHNDRVGDLEVGEENSLIGKSNLFRSSVKSVIKQRKIITTFIEVRERKLEIQKQQKSIFKDIFHLLDLPFSLLRKLTIPPSNENYNHTLLIIYPIFGIPFLLLNSFPNILKNYPFLIISISLTLSFIFYKTSPNSKKDKKNLNSKINLNPEKNTQQYKNIKNNKNEKKNKNPNKNEKKNKNPNKNEKKKISKLPKYYLLINLLTITTTLIWTNLLCSILIDLLTFTGTLTSTPPTYLGLTIIAISNALPDALTTIALASQGQARLALIGGVLGQLFGLLFGFGVAMLKKCVREGVVVFDLFERPLDFFVLVVVFFVFFVYFGFFVKAGGRLEKGLARVLIGVYAVFFFGATAYVVYKGLSK